LCDDHLLSTCQNTYHRRIERFKAELRTKAAIAEKSSSVLQVIPSEKPKESPCGDEVIVWAPSTHGSPSEINPAQSTSEQCAELQTTLQIDSALQTSQTSEDELEGSVIQLISTEADPSIDPPDQDQELPAVVPKSWDSPADVYADSSGFHIQERARLRLQSVLALDQADYKPIRPVIFAGLIPQEDGRVSFASFGCAMDVPTRSKNGYCFGKFRYTCKQFGVRAPGMKQWQWNRLLFRTISALPYSIRPNLRDFVT
jgi:hypothetical protein